MSKDVNSISGDVKSLFKPFTRDSLASIEARIAGEHAKQNKRKKKRENNEVRYDVEDEDGSSQPDPTLEQGLPLPVRMQGSFPSELASTPLEDIDPFYHNQRTFVVINKRKYIFRFSATKALWTLGPFNPIRRAAINILLHPLFGLLIISTILVNCIFMIMPITPTIESTEIIFTGVYTLEFVVKVIARGFILQPFTYLRDPWNWLDFVLIILAYLTLGIDVENLAVLRALRVFRALKTVAIAPGLRTIADAVLQSIKNLCDVIILTIFSLSVFALVGLQMYMGVLTQKCIRIFPQDGTWGNLTDESWERFCQNETNWYEIEGFYPLCGNSSGAGQCEPGYICLQGYGPNPNYGYTNFDTFSWAFLSAFRLMTQDYWENLYQLILGSAGPWHILFFITTITLGSFYLLNLFFAIVVRTYSNLQNKAEGEAKEALMKLTKSADTPDKEPFTEEEKASDQNVKDDNKEETATYKNCFMRGIDFFCVWDCCWLWLKFQKCIAFLVSDPFFELFIMLCLVLNTLFMALDHHDMDRDMERVLKTGNYFFTATFVFEAVLKIMAMSPKYYFRERWNIFDFTVVVLSLSELMLEGVQGLSVLRSFRLLRTVRLVKSWPTFNSIMSIIAKPVVALVNLTFVLCIVIFIFAVMGMQLYGKSYVDNVYRFPDEELPRWNFTDFLHSFMIVFRVLCGEWIESMWDCMLVGDVSCIPFFLATVFIGNLVILNLFLALLVSNFTLGTPTADKNANKIAEAFSRICRFTAWIKRNVANFVTLLVNQIHTRDHNCQNEKASTKYNIDSTEINKDNRSDCELKHYGYPIQADDTVSQQSQSHKGSANKINDGERKDTSKMELTDIPADCCPKQCYRCIPSFVGDGDSAFWRGWGSLRLNSLKIVENKYFEAAILTTILLNCLALTFEDINLPFRPLLRQVLYYMDIIFTVIFVIEMLIKWIAFGFRKYFTDPWCLLDFIIVMLSLVNHGAVIAGAVDIPAFRSMRTLRALRPLRAVSRWEGMRVVIETLVQAIPSVFSVLMVCLFLWLIFAIMGVQLFAGKYYKCIDNNETIVSHEIIPDRRACISAEYMWENSPMNFDHIGKAYLSLFQVATFKGWIQIMNDAIDSREVGQQPIRETNIYMYLYFVYFIIIGSFFTRGLFISVIFNKYKEQKKKAGESLNIFLTEDQKKYYNAMKVGSKKDFKTIPRPKWRPQAKAFEIVTNKRFDLAIMIIIGLNMLVLMFDHYQQSHTFSEVLDYLHLIFIVLFTVECLLKIFALRHHYFIDPWNLFDFVVVVSSILSLIMSDFIEKYFVSPTLLRIVRVARIGRVLQLIRGSKNIRTLLHTLAMSMPALLIICLIQFLVMFIYAVFGMCFFMHVKNKSGIDEIYSFKTFGQSMILLFQISTTAGWDGVLDEITNEKDCDLPDKERGFPGNCGSATIGVIYMVSYILISYFVFINMNIAIILENYSQATEDVQEGLTDDDYDMYYETWQRFDPNGSQYIRYDQLSDFLDLLEPPLQIPKPNKDKIISMGIPVCRGDMMYCSNILDALIKDFFTRKGKIIAETGDVATGRPDDRGLEYVATT